MDVIRSAHAAASSALSTTAEWTSATVRHRPLVWPTYLPLPVAGLDVLAAQTVLYTLRTSLIDDQGPAAVESWLQTLQLAQIASDRLLESLSVTQKHLNFWRGRLKAGSHESFMLLSQGPVGFVRELITVLHHAEAAWHHRFGQRQPRASATAGGDGVGSEGAPSDRIQERIVTLQLLFDHLAGALAAVHNSAAALRVCGSDTAAAAAGPAAASNGPPQPGTPNAALSAVQRCLSGLTAALEQLTPEVHELQQYETAARQVQRTLSGVKLQHDSKQQQQSASAAPQGPDAEELQQQLSVVCRLLGMQQSDLKHGLRRGDAGAALAAASALAHRLGPLVHPPPWALMPSSLQRHWIKYTIAAAAGASAAAFLYRHSRLAGSSDLDDWAAAAAAAVKGAWADHVVSPLVVVRDELFSTFRDRPSMVSTSEFEADKQSLLRMLTDFQQDHPAAAAIAAAITNTPAAPAPTPATLSSPPTAAPTGSSVTGSSSSSSNPLLLLNDSDAVNKGMQVVMGCYERDLKSPIRNLITGELARTLLIQVQRLKLDTEAAMLELDQILRANELSISLVAAVPALLLSWTLLRGIWMVAAPSPPDPKREAMPCRLAMADLERALSALANTQQPGSHEAALSPKLQQQQLQLSAAEGVVLFRLFRVYREAQVLYRLKDKKSKYSEWPHLQSDLMEMVQPAMSATAKLDLHGRMTRTYTVLKP